MEYIKTTIDELCSGRFDHNTYVIVDGLLMIEEEAGEEDRYFIINQTRTDRIELEFIALEAYLIKHFKGKDDDEKKYKSGIMTKINGRYCIHDPLVRDERPRWIVTEDINQYQNGEFVFVEVEE